MFENTLLIIKSDCMPERRCLLLHLMSKGFQIQGSRKLAFTPEDAAEFYQDLSDDKCYMLYVILLSKGTSEAFILAKANAVESLLDTMICYFGTSIEMDRNVHVSRNCRDTRREISFIFPNYIHEPIEYFEKQKFCKQPILAPLISEVFNIIKEPSDNQHDDWRLKLSDWLLKSNPDFPEISNECSSSRNIQVLQKYQQTNLSLMKRDEEVGAQLSMSSKSSLMSLSDMMSSSSCVSCSSFRSKTPCPDNADIDEFQRRLEMRTIKTCEPTSPPQRQPQTICDDEIDQWLDVQEDSVQCKSSSEDKSECRSEGEFDEACLEYPSSINVSYKPEAGIEEMKEEGSLQTMVTKKEEGEEEDATAIEEIQKVIESAAEPAPAPEPVADPGATPDVPPAEPAESAEVPVSEPIKSAAEPAIEPVQAAPEPAVEPVEAAPEPAIEPVQPAPEPAIEPVQPAPEPAIEPVQPAPEPAIEPVNRAESADPARPAGSEVPPGLTESQLVVHFEKDEENEENEEKKS